jgi:ketosteroid isomerase-like protein
LKNNHHSEAIRLIRQYYNEAILNRNVAGICSFFTDDYHVITARGDQYHGLDLQHDRWQAAFQADPIMIYRRRTRELRLSALFGGAEELGNWVGKYSANQKVVIVSGVYSAKWQKQADGLWLIQSEVFTLLKSRTYER